VLDRFSYRKQFENRIAERTNFSIRLKVGPKICDGEDQPVVLIIRSGETCILNKVFSNGKVFVNVIGVWREGFSEQLWVTPAAYQTQLQVQVGLTCMTKYVRPSAGEQAPPPEGINGRLVLVAYFVVLTLGKTLRSQLFPEGCRKNKLFSGPFILLKLKPLLSPPVLACAQSAFRQPILPVRPKV
jgi:hypothetical protein